MQRLRLEREDAGDGELLEARHEPVDQLPMLGRVGALAEKVARAVEHDPPGLPLADGVGERSEHLVRPDALASEIDDLDEPRRERRLEREAEALRHVAQLLGALLERHEEPGLLRSRSFEEKLHPERGLSDTGAARDEGRAAFDEASTEERIETRNAGGEPRCRLSLARRGRLRAWAQRVVAREHGDASLADQHVVAPLQVRRVAKFVHLEIALPLETFARRREENDAVDHGLLHAEAADEAAPVRNVGGEEAHRVCILDERRDLEGLLACDLRVLHLVQKHRQRIDDHALRAERLDPLAHHLEMLLDQDVGLRDEDDLHQSAGDLAIEIPPEAAR